MTSNGVAKAWPDGTRVVVLDPHKDAGAEGDVIDWVYAFASESRRYWVQLDEKPDPILVHESELRREEPS